MDELSNKEREDAAMCRKNIKRYARFLAIAKLEDDIESECGVVAEREFRFHPSRKWRFDVAIPELKIALEVEGGVFVRGRHVRPTGFLKDMEKYNEATLLGWRVFRCTWKEVGNGEALKLLIAGVKNESLG